MKWLDRITGKAEREAYQTGIEVGYDTCAIEAISALDTFGRGQLRVKQNAIQACADRLRKVVGGGYERSRFNFKNL